MKLVAIGVLTSVAGLAACGGSESGGLGGGSGGGTTDGAGGSNSGGASASSGSGGSSASASGGSAGSIATGGAPAGGAGGESGSAGSAATAGTAGSAGSGTPGGAGGVAADGGLDGGAAVSGTAGSAGSAATGAGGATAGAAGASAGAGGTAAGAGGTSAGAGGADASAGSSGQSGTGGVVDGGGDGAPPQCTTDIECDDGVFCNGDEACTLGACVAGTTPVCPPDVFTCTQEVCDPGSDTCTSVPSDALCQDNNECNGAENCAATTGTGPSGCAAGAPLVCNDGVPCTADSCVPGMGCVQTPVNSACSDSTFCNGVETCTLTGCVAGTPPTCDDGYACTTDSCSAGSDQCVNAPDNSQCSDGLFCNGAEQCSATGAPGSGCTAGTAVVCPPDVIACTTDACDESRMSFVPGVACVKTFNNALCPPGQFCTSAGCFSGSACTNNAQCQDGTLCNGVETCDLTVTPGVCRPGTLVNCNDNVYCTVDACTPATGQCTHAPVDSACQDGDLCNGDEVCNVTLGCQAGPSLNCNDNIVCTIDTCISTFGCLHTPNSGACQNGVTCDGAEVCDASTGCQSGAAVVCAPDGVACTVEQCVEPGGCASIPNNALCACGQTCDAALGCGNFCTVRQCSNGNTYQCGDCIDNDNDCRIDALDTQCLGPCDNTENSGPPQGSGCFFQPPPGTFAPTLDCAWNGPTGPQPYPASNDIVMTPVVVNVTNDNGDGVIDENDVPDIGFVTYDLQGTSCCNSNGVLRVLSGRCNTDGTMQHHFSVGFNEILAALGTGRWFDNSGGLATGDIDGDGLPEFVGTAVNGGTIAVEHDGTPKWYSIHPQNTSTFRDHLAGTTPSIANIDNAGNAEVISGRVVLNGADGTLRWRGTAGRGTNGFMGPVSHVADIDQDGRLEVMAGNTLYSDTGTVQWSYAFPDAATSGNCGNGTSWGQGYNCDGFTASANFDADAFGEIVNVRIGHIYILNHDGTPMMVNGSPVNISIPVSTCSRNEGGPPTIADFDGDGQPEIGVAGANFYVVADLECLATPLPAQCIASGIRWRVANQDCSSRVTGSSVFDFDGDGNAEVIYNDETLFRAFNGTTGATLLSIPNRSHTRLEMPIVADVDNDGNAEIVFIENAFGGTTQGIRVYADATDSWVATRRIWNQHAYHHTNVNEDGTIPNPEPTNWLTTSQSTVSGLLNNFRQNLPDFPVLAAPDLSVTANSNGAGCPASLIINANVCNDGDLLVAPGVPVTFYNNATQAVLACAGGAPVTTTTLNPTQCENVTCTISGATPTFTVRVCVDNTGYACTSGGNSECDENNNANTALVSSCGG